jgi:hypothetical protein
MTNDDILKIAAEGERIKQASAEFHILRGVTPSKLDDVVSTRRSRQILCGAPQASPPAAPRLLARRVSIFPPQGRTVRAAPRRRDDQ